MNFEYVMVARMKVIYRANTNASSIFFVGDSQDPTNYEKNL